MKRWQVVVLVVIVALGLSGIGVARFLMPYQLEDEIESAKAHGVATSFAECFAAVPPSQDAGPDYERMETLSVPFWQSVDLTSDRSLRSPAGPTDAEMQTLRAALANSTALLSAVHSAAAKSGCAYHFSSTGRAVDPFSHIEAPVEAAHILRTEALVHMWNGGPVQAARILGLGVNVAKHSYAHPTREGARYGSTTDAIVDSGYQLLLMKAGANAEVDRLVRQSLQNNLTRCDVTHALSGGVAEDCWSKATGLVNLPVPPFAKGLYSKATVAASIHWRTRLIVASRVPPDQQRAAIRRVIDEYQNAARHNPVVRAGAPELPYTLFEMDRLDAQTARRRTIYAAACVLEYRARTGKYPVDLRDAVKPVPTDPFTGAPLSYKRTTNGFELVFVDAARGPAATTTARMLFTYTRPGGR